MAHFATACGHAYIETLTDVDFKALTFIQRITGLIVRTAPLYCRALLLLSYCFLASSALQIMLLPECNGVMLIVAISKFRCTKNG